MAGRSLNDPLPLIVSGRNRQQQTILRQQLEQLPFSKVPQTNNMDKIIKQTPEHVDVHVKGECETPLSPGSRGSSAHSLSLFHHAP